MIFRIILISFSQASYLGQNTGLRLARRTDLDGRSKPNLGWADRSVQVPVARKSVDGAVTRGSLSVENGTRPYVGVVVFGEGNWDVADDGLCLTGADDVDVVERDPAEDDGGDARRRKPR